MRVRTRPALGFPGQDGAWAVLPSKQRVVGAIYSHRSRAQGGHAWTRHDVAGDGRHRLYAAHASTHSVLGRGDERHPVVMHMD